MADPPSDQEARDQIVNECWKHFKATFPDGDEVVVETSAGEFHYGKLVSKEHTLLLVRPEGRWIELQWDNIELVAHDGFPVRSILKMTVEEAVERAMDSPDKIIAEALGNMKKSATFGGGCPFEAGPCELIGVHNRGSRELWGSGAEVMTFKAKDGAMMLNYCTSHLFLF